MHKLYFLILSGIITGFACQMPQHNSNISTSVKTHTITHFNLIFAPDLSNRLSPVLFKRPLDDKKIFSIVTQNLYPSIVRYKRSENQLDKLRIDFINKGLIALHSFNTNKLMIDLGRFTNQNDRIAYILERNNAKQTLKKDTTQMRQEFDRIHSLAAGQPAGADIWSYFEQGLDKNRVLVPEKPISNGENMYINAYRNILILTTDGYIEADASNQKGFDLSQKNINRFRKAFWASGESDIETFYKKAKQFQIKPVKNENLKNLEVLVMELYDRSLSQTGSATVHPTDMEIIKLFWTDWLQKSQVKRFELHPYAISNNEAENIFFNFLGIPKINTNN